MTQPHQRMEETYTWEEIVQISAKRLREHGIVKGFKDFMRQREHIGYCFDWFMFGICFNILKNLNKDQDYFIVIVGKEGSGKSTLSFNISNVVDLEFNLSKVNFEAITYYENLRKYFKIAQVIDEGGLMLFGRKGMSNANISLNQVFTIMRVMNNLTIINIPDYKKLDPGVRSRVDLIIRTNNIGGKFTYTAYWGEAIKHINNNLHKVSEITHIKVPNGYFWQGRFRKDFPPGINREEYDKKKMHNVHQFIDDLILKEKTRKKYLKKLKELDAA